MTAETSNAREWVDLLERAVPFLLDEGAKYDDDGSNEPLELAREIETLLASLSSDESALSPASLAFDGGREATPCPHTRDTSCDCAAPPPADAEVRRSDLRNLILLDAEFAMRGSTSLDLTSIQRLETRAWVIEGHENGEYDITEEGRRAIVAALSQPEPKPVLSEPDRIGLYQGPDDCPQLMVNDRPVAIFPAGSWAKVCDALDSITGSVQPDPKAEARGVVDDLIHAARNAATVIRNCVNARQIGKGYAYHADALDAAIATLTEARNVR